MATMSDEQVVIDGGGPAFPLPEQRIDEGDGVLIIHREPGMSLRDYFAAKVMAAELLTAGAVEEAAIALNDAADAAGQTVQQRIAILSYQMADAMLVERQRPAKREAVRETLRVVSEVLHSHESAWLHEGDNESGQHDEDCRACEYQALLARVDAALGIAEV